MANVMIAYRQKSVLDKTNIESRIPVTVTVTYHLPSYIVVDITDHTAAKETEVDNLMSDEGHTKIGTIDRISDLSTPDGWSVSSQAEVTTTDATQNNAIVLTLDDGEVYLIEIVVTGIKSDETDRGTSVLRAFYYRTGGGSVNIQGSVDTVFDERSNTNWKIELTLSGNDVRASVTGLASTTINWKCSMRYIEVSS